MLQSDKGVNFGITSYGALAPMLSNIISRETLTQIDISYLDSRRFYGDLYGLLRSKNIEVILWPVIMVANGYSSPGEYSGNTSLIGVAGNVARQVMTRMSKTIVSLG